MTTRFLKLVSLGAAILGAACGDYSRAVAPNSTPRLAATASTLFSPARAKTVDERYAEVAAQASRFAGAVMAPDGAIELQVAGAGNAAIDDETMKAFRAVFLGATARRQVRVVHVRWSFAELSAARSEIERAADGLLISSDIDEAHNRVAFVARDEESSARVRSLASALGVGAAAVSVVRGTPPREMTTLSDFVRPVMGAMENDMQQVARVCTLSFAVQYYGSGTDYLATNGHCTGTRWAVDSPMTLRQPTYWAADYPVLGAVGSEAVDPALLYGIANCGANRFCRYSDAALFTVSSATVTAQIAQTTYSSSTPGTSGSVTLASTEVVPVF